MGSCVKQGLWHTHLVAQACTLGSSWPNVLIACRRLVCFELCHWISASSAAATEQMHRLHTDWVGNAMRYVMVTLCYVLRLVSISVSSAPNTHALRAANYTGAVSGYGFN